MKTGAKLCGTRQTLPLRQEQRPANKVGSLRVCASGESNSRANESSSLTATLKRKQRQLSEVLQEYTNEELFDRLGLDDDPAEPSNPMQHRFTGLIPDTKFREGRPVVVVELRKPSPNWTSADLADLAQLCADGGADAVVVPTDAADTSTGLGDLLAVCRRVKIPVIRRDWILHPIQIHEAKEAGAAGVMGLICSVLGRHTVMYSSYAASIGIDCPVEIVNAEELDSLQGQGVPFFGCNLGVGLSMPEFRGGIARNLVEKMNFGISSMVGVTNLEDAVKARESGADMIFVKHEWGMSHFVQEAQRLGLGSASVHEDQLVPAKLQQQNTRKTGQSSNKAESWRDLIADFIRNLKYELSGDA